MKITLLLFQGEISTILAEGRVAEEKNRQEQKWRKSTRTHFQIFFPDPAKESFYNFSTKGLYILYLLIMCIHWVIWWVKITVKIVLPHYYSISHTPHTHSMRRVLEKEVKLTHHKKITTSASTSKYGFKYDADQNNIANQPSDFFSNLVLRHTNCGTCDKFLIGQLKLFTKIEQNLTFHHKSVFCQSVAIPCHQKALYSNILGVLLF